MNGDIAVIDILKNDSGVSEIINGRVYLHQAPQKATHPFVIVEEQDIEPYDTKDGVSALDLNRISVFPYAEIQSQLNSLAWAIRRALDGKSGQYNGVEVQYSRYVSQSGFDEEFENKQLYAKEMGFELRVVLPPEPAFSIGFSIGFKS